MLPILATQAAEHSLLGEHRLVAKPDTGQVDVTLRRRAGYRPECAWTACDYAEGLLERADPGDREKALALQDEALAMARELGMRPLMERILARREILKA